MNKASNIRLFEALFIGTSPVLCNLRVYPETNLFVTSELCETYR